MSRPVVVDTLTAEDAISRSPVALVAGSVTAGLILAVVWSYEFVDQTIGDNVANALLGYEAREAAITGAGAGALFAFVSGLAGTFTACNIAAFSAVAPLACRPQSARQRVTALLRPLGWLSVGMLAVSMTYGAVGALLGSRLPQLSSAATAGGMPVRLLQSTVVFGVIGLVFVWFGLAAVGIVPDPLARLRQRLASIDLLVIGALIGAFLIGRPFGLFFKLFQYAAERHEPFYGALAFGLQSLGNVLIMAVLFLGIVFMTGGRLAAWLSRSPGRAARLTCGAFLVAGAFTFVYWVLRVPAIFGYGWFPTMPWQ